MSSNRRKLTPSSSVETLKKEAKRWLKELRDGDAVALARFASALEQPPAGPGLRDVQHALAREHGFDGWIALTRALTERAPAVPGRARKPLIRPHDLRDDEKWEMIRAAHAGELGRMRELAARRADLVGAEYNYTPPIHFAVREGHTEMVRWLLEQGVDATYRSYPFQESLLGLAEDHQHHEIARLLRERLAQRFPIAEGLRELLEAAKAGNVAAVRAELARDPALAAAANEKGDTALHFAAQKGHLEVARLLLDAGARVDAQRDDGKRPINFTLGNQYNAGARVPPMTRLLLDRGADYNIYVAAWLGDLAFVREALARDASLANFQDSCTEYPIQAAAARRDRAMAKALLEAGADPNRASLGAPRGGALWSASYYNDLELARLLVAHGADPNADVESSGSVMMHAAKHPDMLALLKAHGGIVHEDRHEGMERLVKEGRWAELEREIVSRGLLDKQNEAGWGDGIMAGPARDGNHKVIELLYKLGARVPDVTKWGRAYYFKHTETAALLLKLGMNPNHRTWHWVTLLHDMAQEGDIAKATLLLDHGADIDAVDEEYRSTPLGFAARWGRQEMVAFLVGRGADLQAAGEAWATPLAWATRKRYPEIAAILKYAGATR